MTLAIVAAASQRRARRSSPSTWISQPTSGVSGATSAGTNCADRQQAESDRPGCLGATVQSNAKQGQLSAETIGPPGVSWGSRLPLTLTDGWFSVLRVEQVSAVKCEQ